jgi:hypothetical protein
MYMYVEFDTLTCMDCLRCLLCVCQKGVILHCYVQLIVNTILNTLIDLHAVLNLKCFDGT